MAPHLEIELCQCCGKLIQKTEDDGGCVDCAASFAWGQELPHTEPRPTTTGAASDSSWEQLTSIAETPESIGRLRWHEMSDNDACSETSYATAGEPDAPRLPDGELDAETVPPPLVYSNLAEVFHIERRPLPLGPGIWAQLTHGRLMSRCWVRSGGRSGLRKFGAADFQETLADSFLWDAPMGIILINIARRKCLHVNHQRHVEKCHLGSAIHYLRAYSAQTIGFVMCGREMHRQRLAVIQCAHCASSFEDGKLFHKLGCLCVAFRA